MEKETLSYVAKIALRNYTIVFGLLLLVGVGCLLLGNPMELVLLKLAIVPLFFLSFGGLRIIYRHPIFEHKITLRSAEYSVLEGLIFSLFLFVVLWRPEHTVNELLGLFGMIFLAFTLVKLVMLALITRKIADEGGAA